MLMLLAVDSLQSMDDLSEELPPQFTNVLLPMSDRQTKNETGAVCYTASDKTDSRHL